MSNVTLASEAFACLPLDNSALISPEWFDHMAADYDRYMLDTELLFSKDPTAPDLDDQVVRALGSYFQISDDFKWAVPDCKTPEQAFHQVYRLYPSTVTGYVAGYRLAS